jgi:hypothetical protein
LKGKTAAEKIGAGAAFVPLLSRGGRGIFHPGSSYNIAAPSPVAFASGCLFIGALPRGQMKYNTEKSLNACYASLESKWRFSFAGPAIGSEEV